MSWLIHPVTLNRLCKGCRSDVVFFHPVLWAKAHKTGWKHVFSHKKQWKNASKRVENGAFWRAHPVLGAFPCFDAFWQVKKVKKRKKTCANLRKRWKVHFWPFSCSSENWVKGFKRHQKWPFFIIFTVFFDCFVGEKTWKNVFCSENWVKVFLKSLGQPIFCYFSVCAHFQGVCGLIVNVFNTWRRVYVNYQD